MFLSWALTFALGGFAPFGHESLPAAPVDIPIGRHEIKLRAPLHAKSPGARLVLFVRDSAEPGARDVHAAFRDTVPPGSIVAYLEGRTAKPLMLEQADYTWHRGYAGVVLAQSGRPRYRELYDRLVIESSVALADVRVVWLSRGSKRVEDLVRW